MMRDVITCFAKDFKVYFQSKLIYLILFIYVAMMAGLTFFASNFYNGTSLNMYQFFRIQPGILAMIIPALTMRQWADETKFNTLEVLLAQPISYWAVVLGKFLAVWAITGIMLLASTGFWLTVSLITSLDNQWIMTNYLITFLMAGSLSAISLMAAAFCYNALGAFLASLTVCMIVTMAGFSSWLSRLIPDSIWVSQVTKAFDFGAAYDNMIQGQVVLASLFYYVVLAFAALWLSAVAVDYKRR